MRRASVGGRQTASRGKEGKEGNKPHALQRASPEPHEARRADTCISNAMTPPPQVSDWHRLLRSMTINWKYQI